MTSNWKKCKIGDLCATISDTYKGDDEKVVLINTSDVLEGKILNHELIDNKNLKGQFKKTFQKNDILYSEIRPANKRFAFVDIEYTANYIASTKLMVIRPYTDLVLPQYLYMILKSQPIIDELQHLAETRSGTFPQITFSAELAPMDIKIPPLETQQKIAKVLSAIDDKIELNNSINNNLEQQAQALFYEIYNNGKCGTIGDILEIIETGSRPKGGALTHGVPSIGAENINGFGVYDYSKDKFISAEFYNKLNRGIVKSKDVLLYKDGAYTGKVSMTLDDFPHKQCAVNEHVFLLRTNKLATQFFLYFCLLDNSNRQKIHTLACGKAAQPGLNQNELKSVPIKIPNIEDIINFDITVTPIMKQIANNAKEKQKLAQLRDTLLPKLMSGEIDVSKVDISADKLLFSEEKNIL